MKKTIIKGMTALLLMSAVTIPGYAGVSFNDLGSIKEASAIIALSEKNIVKGTGNNRFEPLRAMTYAESVQLLVNTFGLNIDHIRFIKEPKASDYFKFANDDAWYAGALIIAPLNGAELSSDMIPDIKITREAFIDLFVSLLELKEDLPLIKIAAADIADRDLINPEYNGVVDRALYYGIVSLDEKGNFRPTDAITRAEAAEWINNLLAFQEGIQ